MSLTQQAAVVPDYYATADGLIRRSDNEHAYVVHESWRFMVRRADGIADAYAKALTMFMEKRVNEDGELLTFNLRLEPTNLTEVLAWRTG